MIILDTTTRKLQAVMGGAATTNNPDYVIAYVDITANGFTPGSGNGILNGNTAVDILAAPAASTYRQVKYISIQNTDTVSQTITLRYNDNGTIRKLDIVTLLTGYGLTYSAEGNVQVTDGNGNILYTYNLPNLTTSTGIVAQTASNTYSARTITGTSNEITVTTGDGVSGNPTLSLPSSLTFTGKTVTGGTYNSPTLTTPVLGTPSSGNITACTGAVVQSVIATSTAVATGTTVIPWDDTIPQNTEGNQYLTASITPTNTSNKLVIEVFWYGTSNVATTAVFGALFQDSTANALAACHGGTGGAGQPENIILCHTMTAGTTSSTTFNFRAGSDGAGTTTFNGAAGARKFGGVYSSRMVITEYRA